jgi:TM2 domain-containing membrane protein YozV
MEEKVVVKQSVKSPTLAGILSALFPFGIGAFYNGEVSKGFIYLFIFAGLVSMQHHGSAQPFIALVLAGFYFFQIIDSINMAKRINRRTLQGEGAKEEEEDVTAVVKSGSVFWGALLIVIGGILLLANFEVIAYDKIFNLWPVVVIVIGAKLVFDYFFKAK